MIKILLKEGIFMSIKNIPEFIKILEVKKIKKLNIEIKGYDIKSFRILCEYENEKKKEYIYVLIGINGEKPKVGNIISNKKVKREILDNAEMATDEQINEYFYKNHTLLKKFYEEYNLYIKSLEKKGKISSRGKIWLEVINCKVKDEEINDIIDILKNDYGENLHKTTIIRICNRFIECAKKGEKQIADFFSCNLLSKVEKKKIIKLINKLSNKYPNRRKIGSLIIQYELKKEGYFLSRPTIDSLKKEFT